MTVSRINTPINPAYCSVLNDKLQNSEHAKNDTSFGMKPINNEGWVAKKINKIGDWKYSAAFQRFISGVTAIFTQPFFDLHNKYVDEDTRKTSAARTLGKIIAGTLTGVAIRWACVKATENYTRTEKTEEYLIKNNKADKALKEILPKHQKLLTKEMIEKATYREIKNYRSAFGTLAAVGIMLFTNFLIDAPLTTYLTNKIVKKIKTPNSSELKQNKGGQ